MSRQYTADGKRISSMSHARHTWTCSCGKKTRGNGGRSSHQRACEIYQRERIEFARERITKFEAIEFPTTSDRWHLDRYLGTLAEHEAALAAILRRRNLPEPPAPPV